MIFMNIPIHINYQSQDFPSRYGLRSGVLSTDMHELLWAALTIGRPSKWHVFRHGEASLYEALFRLSVIRMAVQRGKDDRLCRTNAFKALDPTEKGMISYFLGMTCCKLFATQLLDTPWLLHLDVFYRTLGIDILGRSRPDLVGQDGSGCWHAFECKGRSARPSESDKETAKRQARRLETVGGVMTTLHVGSVAFFTGDQLEFYWKRAQLHNLSCERVTQGYYLT